MQMTAKRSDYRTNPAGESLGHYLLNGYLLGENYHPANKALPRSVMSQLHYTDRNPDGGFNRTEFGGVPAQKTAWVNHLDGFSVGDVRAAIEAVRRVDPVAIAALEWHQKPASRRPTRYLWAADHGVTERTLSDKFKSAVRQVGDWLEDVRRERDKEAGR